MPLTTGTFADMRARLELVVRLGCRASQMMAPAWSDVIPMLTAAVVGASAASDLLLVAWLRTLPPDKQAWLVRLAHLSVDVAGNIAIYSDGSHYVPALVPAYGLALEAGYSGNASATVAVPLACLAGVAVGRAVRKRPLSPTSPVLLTGMVGALAWGLRWYEAAQIRGARRAEQIDIDAMAADARAAAHFWLYNNLDGSRLLDDLKNAINPLLSADTVAVVAVQAMLQEQKEDALRPPTTVITLRRALADAEANRYWEATNRASTFRPTVDDRSGPMVLTPRQAQQLLDWIDREFVSGRPTVRVLSGGHEIGAGLTLSIGGRRCHLRADQAPIELGPLGWVAAAAMVATTAGPWDGSVRPAVAATSSGLFLGSALAARMILHRRGRPGREAAIVIGALPALVHALGGAVGMKDHRSPTGLARYPAVVPLMAVALEAGHYWQDLGPRAKLALAAIGGAAVAPSWRSPDHYDKALLASLVWPAQYFILTRDLRRLVDDMTSAAAADAKDAAELRVLESKRVGVDEEVLRLRRWVDDADRVLAAAVEADEELRTEAAARLAIVRVRLVEIADEATLVSEDLGYDPWHGGGRSPSAEGDRRRRL